MYIYICIDMCTYIYIYIYIYINKHTHIFSINFYIYVPWSKDCTCGMVIHPIRIAIMGLDIATNGLMTISIYLSIYPYVYTYILCMCIYLYTHYIIYIYTHIYKPSCEHGTKKAEDRRSTPVKQVDASDPNRVE